jgi:uncharacterized protein with GYD domain
MAARDGFKAAGGNVRSVTMPAFDEHEMRRMAQGL